MHQRQAKAAALRRVGGIPLVKLVKNVPDVLRVNADALVPHRHGNAALLLAGGEKDGSALPAELDGVAEQVQPDVLHHLGVAPVGQPGQVQLKHQILGRPLAFQPQHAGADLLVQIVVGLLPHQFLAFVLGKQQHAAGQVRQTLGFLHDKIQVFVLLLLGQAAPPQPAGKAADGDDGGLELVGKGVDKIVAHQLGAAQLGGHAVKAVQQLGNVAGALLRHPHGIVPAGDGFGGLHHVLDGFGRPPADNNSLIVESGDRYRYISYNDIYVTESSMYSYTYSTSFDGEGAITSAIDYVVTEDLPQLYVLEGHGEAELPSTFSDQLEKENYEVNTLSLLTVDEVPAEADCVLIYAPSTDLSDEEVTMLEDYVAGGGKLLVSAGPTEDGTLTNLYSLLENYGVTAAEGIVVEEDREHYAFGAPYVLLPDLASSDVTDSLIDESYYALMPISQGLTVGSTENGTVTELLTTSDTAFSKAAGYSLSTYDKEDGDIDGPFAVGVSIEDNGGGKIIWFSSSVFLEDMYNASSSGANVDMAMNALSSLVGEREAIAIRSKSLNYNYLTISASTSSVLQGLMIGVFPLAYLAIGIVVIVRKRRLQNETV